MPQLSDKPNEGKLIEDLVTEMLRPGGAFDVLARAPRQGIKIEGVAEEPEDERERRLR